MSRTANSLRNITASLGGQLLNNILRWVCRIVFIYTLGKEYLGISSLYMNILTLLSLTELGLGSAITYSLYRPLAEKDLETVKAQMQFFKHAYRIIGAAIFLTGLCLLPFLPYLMKGTTDAVNIYEYYLLYLIQTVVSYLFFAYKGILLTADQKKYVSDVISYLVQIAVNAVQILILLLFHSFLLYTLVYIICGIARNILVSAAVDRRYPYLKEKARRMSKEETKRIFRRVYAMSLYRIASVVGTATDNLVISSNISVVFVGLYDNYYMIIQVVQKIVSSVFQSFTSSLGNYYVTESLEDNERMFRMLNRANSWLITFCSVSFAALLQPFIGLCFGKDYVLEYPVVLIIVMNFATNYQQTVIQMYKDVTGLFVKGKYRAVATAVLNLGISVVLVKKTGLAGVFLGSIIARLLTTWWYDSLLIFRDAFHRSPIRHYADCIATLLLILFSSASIEVVCRRWSEPSFLSLLVRGVCCLILPNLLCFLLYGRSEECRELARRGRELLNHKLRKHPI